MDENKLNSDINVNLSAGNDKIKYYECNDNNCIFEIVNEDTSDDKTDYIIESDKKSKILNTLEENKNLNGQIAVISVLDYGKHELLQGTKINLYRINGLSPVLIESKVTDEAGKVVFKNIDKGCYRVIEIIDKRFFEKPKYINWNEIIIDENNFKQKIVVVNKLKNKSRNVRV